jgi:hypothetical protein
MSRLTLQITMYACLKKIRDVIELTKANRKFRMDCARMALRMYIRLGMPMRKHAGYEYCMVNKMRNVFTSFNAVAGAVIQKTRATQVIHTFFYDLVQINTLVEKANIWMKSMIALQKRFKDKIFTKDSKVDVIC